MLIFHCDRCGLRAAHVTGCEGAESARVKLGFQSLLQPYTENGVIDVCQTCLSIIESAGARAARSAKLNAATPLEQQVSPDQQETKG